MFKRMMMVIGLVVVTTVLTACGGAASKVVEITVHVSDTFAFEPNEITVGKGDTVKVTVINQGAAIHDLTIRDLKVGVIAQPGETKNHSIKVSKTGIFDILCVQPGHTEAGMKGKLTVQ